MKSIPPTARAAIAGAGGNRRRNLGSVSKLPALVQAFAGVSKTYCFWAWGAVRVGKLLGFFALLSCLLRSLPPLSVFLTCFPAMPLLHRLPGLRRLERPPVCLNLLLFFGGPGARRGVNCVFFYAMFSNVVGMFLPELFVSTMLRYIQATTGCSSKSVDLTSLSYRLPGGSQEVWGLCYSEFTWRCLSYPAGVFQEVSMLIDSTTCVPSRFALLCHRFIITRSPAVSRNSPMLCVSPILSLPYTLLALHLGCLSCMLYQSPGTSCFFLSSLC